MNSPVSSKKVKSIYEVCRMEWAHGDIYLGLMDKSAGYAGVKAKANAAGWAIKNCISSVAYIIDQSLINENNIDGPK